MKQHGVLLETGKKFIGTVLQECCKGPYQEENEEFKKLMQFLYYKAEIHQNAP